jgi:hypothetical protein
MSVASGIGSGIPVDKPQSDVQELLITLSKTLAMARELNNLATDIHTSLFGATPTLEGTNTKSPEPDGVFAITRELITSINNSHNDTANLLGTLRSRCVR